MQPEQPPAPGPTPSFAPPPSAPGNNYDFIVNPGTPHKPPLFGGKLGSNPFVTKIALIVGGAALLMIILTVAINLIFGGRSGVDSLVSVAQTEEEITRLAEEGDKAAAQTTKNAAASTWTVVESHQQEWLAYLAARGRTLKNQELSLKKSAVTDTALTNAAQTSTFDATYNTVMRTQLTDYADLIRDTYERSTVAQQRQMLSKHYTDIELLLKQWPQ